MTNLRHLIYLVIALFLLVAFTIAGAFFLQPPKHSENRDRLVKVEKVIDGDTIELADGQRLRYIGIDAPEIERGDCYAQEARQRNKELVEGKFVRLEKDISQTDQYGRLLRYVYVGDGEKAEEIFVNGQLVQEGLAQYSAVPPDIMLAEKIAELENQAREKKLGLWGDCHLLTVTEEVLGISSSSAVLKEK